MANKRSFKNDMLEMMQMAFAECQATLGMLLTLYSLNVTPETYEKIFKILDSNPDSKKWKEDPMAMPELLGGDHLSIGPLMKKYPEMMHDLISTLTEGKIKDLNLEKDLSNMPDMLREYDDKLAEEDYDDMDNWDDDDDMDSEYVPEPLENMIEKTLLLKIKVKDIKTPPVWRELEVPAWFTFEYLHDTIQIIFGWKDYHLWQFQEKLHKSPYVIKLADEEDEDYFENEEILRAEHIYISAFLKKKGDKMEYLYDYGDNWVCEITVLEVLDKETDYPLLLKAKGDMMLEDIGGPFMYMKVREFMDKRKSMNKNEKLNFLDSIGFESVEHFDNWINMAPVDFDDINEELETLEDF